MKWNEWNYYDKDLAHSWINWAESNPNGARKEVCSFVREWVDKVKPISLLDIGCGQGICSDLISTNISYIGIDPCAIFIKRACKLFNSPNSNRTFKKGNAYKIPLTDQSVEATISIWVWHYLTKTELAAQEMRRILKPGGKFLIIANDPETDYMEKSITESGLIIDRVKKLGEIDSGNGGLYRVIEGRNCADVSY